MYKYFEIYFFFLLVTLNVPLGLGVHVPQVRNPCNRWMVFIRGLINRFPLCSNQGLNDVKDKKKRCPEINIRLFYYRMFDW